MFKARFVVMVMVSALASACGGDDDDDTASPDAAGQPDAAAGQPDAAPDQPDAAPDFDAPPAVGIDAARAAPDGPTLVLIDNVLVTYTKPAIGTDVAGFFVQSVQTGPALFIAVDPAGLSPVPAVGDLVSFRITSMQTAGMLRQAGSISNFVLITGGNSVTELIQNVTAATDLVSAIGNYESELVSATVTVAADFAGAGAGHQAGNIDTTGITGDTNLRLRVPTTLQDTYGFVTTCVVDVLGTPMWRFNAAAQISLWNAADFTATCPAPKLVTIMPTSATQIVLTFDRAIDALTIVTPATQFTFDNGLAATGSATLGRQITLTTTAQSPGLAYQLTIDGSVLDVLGGSAATTNAFNGFGTPEGICNDGLDDDFDGFTDCEDLNCTADAACAFAAQLYLWELDSDTASVDMAEFVEIRNLNSVDVDLTGYYLVFINGSTDLSYLTLALAGTLAPGALHLSGNGAVAGVDVVFSDNTLQNGQDGVLLVHCPACAGAGDIPNGTDVGVAPTFMAGASTATKIDGVAYDTADADDADLMMRLGVAVQYSEGTAATHATVSLHRTSLTGWSVALPSPDVVGVE